MKDREKIKKRIEEEADFIYYPKFGNSLKRALESNPNGLSDETIQKMLLIDESELNEIYKKAIHKLRSELKEEDKD